MSRSKDMMKLKIDAEFSKWRAKGQFGPKSHAFGCSKYERWEWVSECGCFCKLKWLMGHICKFPENHKKEVKWIISIHDFITWTELRTCYGRSTRNPKFTNIFYSKHDATGVKITTRLCPTIRGKSLYIMQHYSLSFVNLGLDDVLIIYIFF